MVGDAAAAELVRMVETIVAGAFNMATIARRTQTAIIGLSVPAVIPNLDVSPHLIRQPSTAAAAMAMPAVETDDEVLSFAVLLSAGSDTVWYEPGAVEHLHSAGARLGDISHELNGAVSLGAGPGRALDRFGLWIMRDYARAVPNWRRASRDGRPSIPDCARWRRLPSTLTRQRWAPPSPAMG